MYLTPRSQLVRVYTFALAATLTLAGCSAADSKPPEMPPSTSTASPHWGGYPLDRLDPEMRGKILGDEADPVPEPEPDYVGDLVDLEMIPKVEASPWADSYVTNELRSKRKIIIYGKSPAPRALQEELRALGATQHLDVEFDATSLMTSAEFVAAVEAAYERISPDRRKFGAIMPSAAYNSVSLAVWEAPDAEATVRALKRALAPLEVRAFVTARPA